jgi:CMP-N,N'-diacetyllegionaminic acid synthase
MSPVLLGLITARSGSKGIPGKNIRLVAGRPLIAWTIQAALESNSLNRVILSTDDKEIAEIGRKWGAEVPFLRPAELAQDNSPHIDVIVHAIEWLAVNENYHPDFLVLLQPTSPLREAQDIDDAVSLALQRDAESVVSVSLSPAHPFFIRRITKDGKLTDFTDKPAGYLPRQALPPAYVENGAIYIARTDILLREKTWYLDATYPYIMKPENSLDIDTNWDLYIADLILRDKLHLSKQNKQP